MPIERVPAGAEAPVEPQGNSPEALSVQPRARVGSRKARWRVCLSTGPDSGRVELTCQRGVTGGWRVCLSTGPDSGRVELTCQRGVTGWRWVSGGEGQPPQRCKGTGEVASPGPILLEAEV